MAGGVKDATLGNDNPYANGSMVIVCVCVVVECALALIQGQQIMHHKLALIEGDTPKTCTYQKRHTRQCSRLLA